MRKTRVLILGATGFVGKNILNVLVNEPAVELISTSRNPIQEQLWFDLKQPTSWLTIADSQPDIIIDVSGYGVVKNQTDLDTLYHVNYLKKRELIDFLFKRLLNLFWIQIGTAFEYSLEQETLTENSICYPKTHYGISKLLFSNYLSEVIKERFCIFRPFGMFGEGEDESKFFPMLIRAQNERKSINLSDGSQYRDYFYVKDLGTFLFNLIETGKIYQLEREVINVGSGKAKTLRELSQIVANQLPDYLSALWNWGVIPQREGENNKFYNASTKATRLGFTTTPLEIAFQHTINHYSTLYL